MHACKHIYTNTQCTHTHTTHNKHTPPTTHTHREMHTTHIHIHTHTHTHPTHTRTHTHTHTHNTHTPASGRHLLLAETVCCCRTASRAGWQKDSHTKHHSTVAEKGAPLHPCWCAEWEQREMGGGRVREEEEKEENVEKKRGKRGCDLQNDLFEK